MGDSWYNYNNGIPCQNVNCRSYGRPHPRCECGGGGAGHAVARTASNLWSKAKGFTSTAAQNIGSQLEGYAEGGEVHYCTHGMPHEEGCDHFADGGTVRENLEFAQDPSLALDHAILANGLHHTLTKTGHSRSEDPGKIPSEFLSAVRRGKKSLEAHAKSALNPDAQPMKSNGDDVAALEKHIEDLRTNPHLAENVGGELGNAFPNHHVQLAGKLAAVMNHFDSIRPKSAQGAPLDNVMPSSKKEMVNYRRQLEIAQNPALIYERAKHAVLQPSDLATIQNIYPKLHQAMVNKAGEAIVDHKSQGKDLSKNAKHGLSILMGQNLGFSQTPVAMQAIIQANAPSQPPTRKQLGGSQNKPTEKAVTESNKTAQLEATADQARQFSRKEV